MSSAASEKASSSKPDFPQLFPTFEIGPFAEFNARNLATTMNAGTAVIKGAAAYWGHIGAFVNKRLQSDSETVRTLCACRTGEDAAHAQHQFVSNMMSDYFNEMHALLTIGANIAKGVAEPIEERAEETIHNIEARSTVVAAE